MRAGWGAAVPTSSRAVGMLRSARRGARHFVPRQGLVDRRTGRGRQAHADAQRLEARRQDDLALDLLGLAAILWAGRFVQTVVYGVSPSDPLTIGAAVALIAGVTALAGGLPARRASNVNPIEALRQQ